MDTYGKELILDLNHCDPQKFNRKYLTDFFIELCDMIDMERCDLHFWDDVGVPKDECQTDPKLKGTSAVQFIMTSSIVVHCLDLLGTVYVNLFSCKDFDTSRVERFIQAWFGGDVIHKTEVDRI